MNSGEKQFQNAVSPRELGRLLALSPRPEVLDVRTPGEFASGHVPGARLAPVDELNAGAFLAGHDRSKPLYVLCQTGGRARKAIELFRRAGFEGCVLVEGGTQAWIDCGLPVNRLPGGTLPLMRQVQVVAGTISATGAALALAVHPGFALIPMLVGCGLLFAGLTGFCGMALLLAKMPWNRRGHVIPTGCCEAKGAR